MSGPLAALLGSLGSWREVTQSESFEQGEEAYGWDLMTIEISETLPDIGNVIGTTHYFVRDGTT